MHAPQVHHIVAAAVCPDPLDVDNLATVCAAHHPKWEAVRRQLLRSRGWRSCTHQHRHAEARRICERRLNRDLIAA
jgi:hypothetical protein